MTTQSELKRIFDQFSKTSIKKSDDGYYLYGHNVNVQAIGDVWDVYLCNMKEFAQGNCTAYLGTKKLNNIYTTLPENINVHRLDCEGYFQTRDLAWLKGWLEGNRLALGIKKRKNSPPVHFGVRMDIHKTPCST